MPKQRKVLLTHVFKGARFAEGGLSVDCLSDLVALKSLIVETAKDIWRARNPEAKRLPPGFEARADLLMYEIKPGSVCIPLERIIDSPEDSLPLPVEDEIDEAASIVGQSVRAARNEEPLPDRLPKRILGEFEKYGRSLRDGESYVLLNPDGSTASEYDATVRGLLLNWQPLQFQDTITLIGELRMVDLDNHRFKLLPTNGNTLPGTFSPDKEALMTCALNQHETKRIKLRVKAEIDILTAKTIKILQVEDYELVLSAEEAFIDGAITLSDIVKETFGSIPSEEWERIPSDLSENLDSYLKRV